MHKFLSDKFNSIEKNKIYKGEELLDIYFDAEEEYMAKYAQWYNTFEWQIGDTKWYKDDNKKRILHKLLINEFKQNEISLANDLDNDESNESEDDSNQIENNDSSNNIFSTFTLLSNAVMSLESTTLPFGFTKKYLPVA